MPIHLLVLMEKLQITNSLTMSSLLPLAVQTPLFHLLPTKKDGKQEREMEKIYWEDKSHNTSISTYSVCMDQLGFQSKQS